MYPDVVLFTQGSDLVAVKDTSYRSLAVEMSVDGDGEDATGGQVAAPQLKALFRAAKVMRTIHTGNGPPEVRWMAIAGNGFICVEPRKPQSLTDQSAG